MKRLLKIGDKVRITLNQENSSAAADEMWEHNFQAAIVSRVLRPRHYTECLYELEGVQSNAGIPYTFTRDMLEVWEVE